MLEIKELKVHGYERVLEVLNPLVGLHAFIAIHSTRLGPALGGTRMFPYSNREEALKDVLNLSKAMTYKSALAGTELGGGKSVIIGDPKTQKTPQLLSAFAEALNYLEGAYIAAEDVGTNTEDMLIMSKTTQFVAALPTDTSSGDPSRFTAWGVFRGMQAIAKFLWGSTSLVDKTIVVQGTGSVGSKLIQHLFWHRAKIIISERDQDKCQLYINLYGVQVVGSDEFASVPCDILAPCAMGGAINATTVQHLRCQAVGGAANNQLSSPEIGEILLNKGILYAPDYVINAGGILNACGEYGPHGYQPTETRDKTDHIYEQLLTIFERSKTEHKPTQVIADEIAEYNLQHLIGQRKKPIRFDNLPSSH